MGFTGFCEHNRLGFSSGKKKTAETIGIFSILFNRKDTGGIQF